MPRGSLPLLILLTLPSLTAAQSASVVSVTAQPTQSAALLQDKPLLSEQSSTLPPAPSIATLSERLERVPTPHADSPEPQQLPTQLALDATCGHIIIFEAPRNIDNSMLIPAGKSPDNAVPDNLPAFHPMPPCPNDVRVSLVPERKPGRESHAQPPQATKAHHSTNTPVPEARQ